MRGSWPSEQQCPAPRSIYDLRREQGLGTTGARQQPAGQGTERSAPCRGGSAYTTPWRTRLRAPADSRRSAVKSFRKQGRTAKRGQWSAWSARDALRDRAHPAPYRRLRHSSLSTHAHRPLLLGGGGGGWGPNFFVRIGGAGGFAERVPAGNERNGLLVIHRHAGESLSDVACRGDGIRVSIGPFRIHIDQTHLHGSERIRKITIAAVALVR